ncbi:hypothetical protein [Streptomyces sp. NPDC002779]|uniref:hypothetical protein n=1 Tax=Streptomyces sp. NPDC002779 TaxID=3364664 RepID=UPI0036A72F03
MTESSAAQAVPEPETGAPVRLFGSRGRHRRPRPRKVLLAAGGLALAAGALSLVRLTPESGLGGLDAPEAEPWPGGDGAPATDHATNAAAAVGPLPRVSPSATTVLGGPGAPTPTAPPSPAPTNPAPTAPPPPQAPLDPATTIPEAPRTDAPQPPATTHPAPQPAAPSRPAHTPAPEPTPGPTDRPGVCLPVIGLCVDPLPEREH